MSIANELALAKIESNPNRRKLDAWIESLSPEEQGPFNEAMLDPEYSHEALYRVVKAMGGKVSASSVRRYRTDVLGVKL